MNDAPAHKITMPGGERLPSGYGVCLRFLREADWEALLAGRATHWMGRAVERLRKPIKVDVQRRRRREAVR